MRILYSGPLLPGSLTESRRQALLALGCEVVSLDQVPYLRRGPQILRRLQLHLLVGPGVAAYNHAIIRRAMEAMPDLTYIDTGIYLWPRTLSALRSICPQVVHYTSEYFGFRRYLYRRFFKTVNLYHAHVITNCLNTRALEERGARQIITTEFGYDPLLHQPPILGPEDEARYAADAVFVGHWEPITEDMILALRRTGIKVSVWGLGWYRAQRLESARSIRPIHREEYVKVLAAAKICLGFLSKWNHNQSAGRTFEVPAVGGFLLAERTGDHQRYYEEGKEAAFFSSSDELVEKARHYLAHDQERKTLARAGYERCLKSGYRHEDRVRRILELLR